MGTQVPILRGHPGAHVSVAQTVSSVQENVNIARATSATAKEAMEVSKTTMKMVRDMKSTEAPSQSILVQSYVTIAARRGLPEACTTL
ncbi:hypothetical protein C2W62_01165 [Candidatus Entotheonella serta]|nr:hypothetical protein C2W62_01165 [Candidatus Entotheonella serta]